MRSFLTPALIVCALGYFVDAFDIVIFSIVRVSSLTELGYSGDALVREGIFLLNMQLAGMLAGGMLWGCIGDRKGRSSALIFSILCYALATIANGFVQTVDQYAICRFISGVGLAGELGAAVTLITEGLPKDRRGMGALVITFLGNAGALCAAIFGGLLHWRYLYFLGGGMGLVLLVARSSLRDSQLFLESKAIQISRGNVLALFSNPRMLKQFLTCFLIGIPHYLCFGVLLTLSPEIAKEMGVSVPVSVSMLLMLYAGFLGFGDVCATLLSQKMKSRRKAVTIFSCVTSLLLVVLYLMPQPTAFMYYTMFGFLGFFAGYVMLVPVIAAETFGINLRVSATSMTTNCVRGSAIVMNLGVAQLRHLGIVNATAIVAAGVMLLTFWAVYNLRETFHEDMEFFD